MAAGTDDSIPIHYNPDAPSPQTYVATPRKQHQQPDKTEDSFDWDALADDEEGLLYLGPSRSSLYVINRYFIYIALGGSIILLPGLISFFCFSRKINPDIRLNTNLTSDGNIVFGNIVATGMAIEQLPFFFYAAFLVISWSSYWLLKFAALTVPEVLIRLSNLVTKLCHSENFGFKITHWLNYGKTLKGCIGFTAWSLVNVITWNVMFPAGDLTKPSNGLISRVFACLLAASIVWSIEKFLLQTFSVHFHKRAYADRVVEAKFTAYILTQLSVAKKYAAAAGGNGGSRDSSYSDMTKSPELISALGHKIKAKIIEKAQDISQGLIDVSLASLGFDLNSTSGVAYHGDPYRLARKMFAGLSRGYTDLLVVDDFAPFFPSINEAKQAFDHFDLDKNGDITRLEFLNGILHIYREHSGLESSMRQSSQAIKKLDSILAVIVYVIILFVSLSIFDINTTAFLTVGISVWAGTLFAVGGSVKNLLESIVFLFFTHPYDVGDRVDVDGQSYTVKKFGLMSTCFISLDGKEIYAPNIVLSTKFIHNIRRSGAQSEEIELAISVDTPIERISALANYMTQYVTKEESREFFSNVTVNIKTIYDEKRMDVTVSVPHKFNWQNGSARVLRRNRFLTKLREGLLCCAIELVPRA